MTRRAKPQGARFEARMSPELHMTVKRAAEIQGRTVTDFVVHTLQIAATQAIEEADLVRLSRLRLAKTSNAGSPRVLSP